MSYEIYWIDNLEIISYLNYNVFCIYDWPFFYFVIVKPFLGRENWSEIPFRNCRFLEIMLHYYLQSNLDPWFWNHLSIWNEKLQRKILYRSSFYNFKIALLHLMPVWENVSFSHCWPWNVMLLTRLLTVLFLCGYFYCIAHPVYFFKLEHLLFWVCFLFFNMVVTLKIQLSTSFHYKPREEWVWDF